MIHGPAGDRNISAGGFDQAKIGGDPRGGIGNRSDENIESADGRVIAAVGEDADLEACRQDGLTGRGGDRAMIRHVRPNQENATAVSVVRHRTGNFRARLDDDVPGFSS